MSGGTGSPIVSGASFRAFGRPKVLYILFDNETLFLGQIDSTRLGGDCRLVSVLRPHGIFRRREDYAETERGGDQEDSWESWHCEHHL
jgi:hypothetical protein